MTVTEILVVVTCLLILAAMLLPVLAAAKRRQSRINCVNNIKQVNLVFRIWEEDNTNQFPMGVSVTNGGALELIQTGNVVGVFQVMSNELSTPKVLVCPDDPHRTSASNFLNDLDGSHISYFVGADVGNDLNPHSILDGDDNFQLNGSPAKSGLFDLSSNTLIEWAPGRHSETFKPHFWSSSKSVYWGNIGFADGSVQAESQSSMQEAFQETGLATNRIAIP